MNDLRDALRLVDVETHRWAKEVLMLLSLLGVGVTLVSGWGVGLFAVAWGVGFVAGVSTARLRVAEEWERCAKETEEPLEPGMYEYKTKRVVRRVTRRQGEDE